MQQLNNFCVIIQRLLLFIFKSQRLIQLMRFADYHFEYNFHISVDSQHKYALNCNILVSIFIRVQRMHSKIMIDVTILEE